MINLLERIIVQGHNLEIYGTKEKPLFLAVDVAKLIDYSVGHTSHMLNTIDEDEKLIATMVRAGQRRDMWFLTEYGMYEVLMQSRKPMARRFKAGVKCILKELRLREEITFEEMFEHSDPLVDEWEVECRRREENEEEDITFEDWLKECKGYTDDMI
jgi:prophage antirepressor-like protein